VIYQTRAEKPVDGQKLKNQLSLSTTADLRKSTAVLQSSVLTWSKQENEKQSIKSVLRHQDSIL
jgi:hypothetical protein